MTTSLYFKPSYKLKLNYLHLASSELFVSSTVLFRQSRLVCIFGGNGGRLYTSYVTETSQALSPLPHFVFFPDFSQRQVRQRERTWERGRGTRSWARIKAYGHLLRSCARFGGSFRITKWLLRWVFDAAKAFYLIVLFLTKVDLCHGTPRYFPVVIFWSCENVVFVFNRRGWNGPWWRGKP